MKAWIASLLVALLCAMGAVSQDFAADLQDADYFTMARPSDGQGYISSIILKGGKVSLLYESMGFTPSILAVRISGESLWLLLKARWTGAEEVSPNEQYPSRYYVVEIRKEDIVNKVMNVLAKLDVTVPTRDFKNFPLLLDAETNNDAINVRSGPSLASVRIAQLKRGVSVHVVGFADQYDHIQNRSDYWYRIRTDGVDGWVFGYYIDGPTQITLPGR